MKKREPKFWLSVTQLSLELHFGAKHDYEEKKNGSTKESRFSKFLLVSALFFFSVVAMVRIVHVAL